MPVRILHGDCRDHMAQLSAEGERFHACVTDPPYHLTSTVKRFGGENAAPAQFGTDGAFARSSRGFMGQTWDGGDVAFQPETWRRVFDCLLPDQLGMNAMLIEQSAEYVADIERKVGATS